MPFDFARRHASSPSWQRVSFTLGKKVGETTTRSTFSLLEKQSARFLIDESFATIGCDAAASSDVGDAASASEYVAAVVLAAAAAIRNGARASARRSMARLAGVPTQTCTCDTCEAALLCRSGILRPSNARGRSYARLRFLSW